jgi:hypothetical protein
MISCLLEGMKNSAHTMTIKERSPRDQKGIRLSS